MWLAAVGGCLGWCCFGGGGGGGGGGGSCERDRGRRKSVGGGAPSRAPLSLAGALLAPFARPPPRPPPLRMRCAHGAARVDPNCRRRWVPSGFFRGRGGGESAREGGEGARSREGRRAEPRGAGSSLFLPALPSLGPPRRPTQASSRRPRPLMRCAGGVCLRPSIAAGERTRALGAARARAARRLRGARQSDRSFFPLPSSRRSLFLGLGAAPTGAARRKGGTGRV
jgi:hypothetical protein